MKKKKRKPNAEYERGRAFVKEPTGSAPLINLDGEWQHDFADHKEE
ncbi:hypothetical protein [Desulfoscipio geothermicus]|uniref:Uncharacterized protein n=1 Tax=Desulfoscipio geothermicus DSM 3669 TaxID=1121426 RepID=A0A1I6DLT8_9FIRM|nr:hypothetical protein [Desulfoscipio geothermicus]SFR06425.1 hypothetical protein SAMN05660706_11358 [Desulfoscipio geothermicus DSM 3669]